MEYKDPICDMTVTDETTVFDLINLEPAINAG